MYRLPERSNFDAVRATWEARNREETLPKPLLADSKLQPLQTLPNGTRRLSSRSFTMFNGQFNPFRSKGFVRGRQSSAGVPASSSSKSSSFRMGSRDSSSNVTSENQQPNFQHTPTAVLTTTVPDHPVPHLIRSKTTSFLPIPTKSVTTLPAKPEPEQPVLIHSQSTNALFRSRIPTPTGLRQPTGVKFKRTAASRAFAGLRKPSSSHLQRANTQPNLVTATGRRASEFARNGAPNPGIFEEAAPLLESTVEEDEEPTPGRIISQKSAIETGQEYRLQRHAKLPHRLNSLQASSECNMGMDFEYEFAPSASVSRFTQPINSEVNTTPQAVKSRVQQGEPHLSSNRVIHCHQLLSPILPRSPPVPPLLPAVQEQLSLTPACIHWDQCEMHNLKAKSKSGVQLDFDEKSKESEASPSLGHNTSTNPIPLHKQVSKAQPAAYWAGRFISLKDSLLNGNFDLNRRITSPSEIDSNESSSSLIFVPLNKDSMYTPEVQQAIHVFETLEKTCTTDAAVGSLLDFRNIWASNAKLPSVERYLSQRPRPNSWVPELGLEDDLNKSTGSQGSYRKVSFMERLKMRSRKSSTKSEKSTGGGGVGGGCEDDRKGLLGGT
jgi:hypothetical protein